MGRFRVLERIGSGGMGVVHRAFDERLQRDVAVKEVAAPDPERVLREAQAAARLNHPGIATLYELGRMGSSAMLVSELVPGATLAEARAGGALADRDVAEIGLDLCDALAHAHAQGVIHRDVKPQNVIVCEDGGVGRRAKLMDFGIARLAGAPTLTRTGEVVGTLAYMAPEQSEGLPAGPEADVYSLALTLYECWAGHNPVAGPTPAATARRIGEPVPPLAAQRPDLPSPLADAIDACLHPDPLERPSPATLRDALARTGAALSPDRPLPAPAPTDGRQGPVASSRLPSLAGAVALAAGLALLAGPAGAPGAALVTSVLVLPGVLLLRGAGALAPPVGGALAAVGASGAFPALAALATAGPRRRALAGALGWAWMVALAAALGAGPGTELAPRAPAGWEASTGVAASALLAPILEPASLAGMAGFAIAAALLGAAISARNVALASLGALVWAAAWVALLPLLAPGTGGALPAVVGLAAAAALGFERARGADRRHGESVSAISAPPVEARRLTAPAPQPAHPGFEAVSSH